jgi:hypothetical protein
VNVGTYNLNLSERYVPGWGAWEVAREIICNAIDADPKGMTISSPGRNTLVVSTTTSPRLSDIFVIGGGTKNIGGETIGQFGEGMKMAALVATRSGGGVVIAIPGQEITFRLEQCLGESVLHAEITPVVIPIEGMTITVTMDGITNAYAGKILIDQPFGIVGPASAGMNVYVKGVYVTSVSNDSLWDWNLATAQINRDRSMVELNEITKQITYWLNENHTPEICGKMIANPDALESNSFTIDIFATPGLTRGLCDAFRQYHGRNACLASDDDKVNARARRHGMNPVMVSQKNLGNVLKMGGIPLAEDAPQDEFDLEPVDSSKYQTQIDELAELAELVEGPGYTLGVMANRSLALGLADIKERRIWMQEHLFTSATKAERFATFLHELAHLRSCADDETREFEHSLTDFLGRLAEKVSA